jgi:hypothetical protein
MKMFEEVTVNSVVDNAIYYRQLLAEESILVFKQLNLPPTEIVDFSLQDYDIDLNPETVLMWSFWCDYNFMESESQPWKHDPVGVTVGQYHSFLLNRRPEEQPEVISPDVIVGNWHKDHYHYPTPTSIIGMNMHTFTCAVGMGDTVIVNLANAYDDCPKHILDYLQDRSYVYTDVCGCEEPPLASEHPALATHPITGRTSLCYPGRDGGGALACVPTDGSVEQWQEYEDWIWEYMNAPENQFRMKWEEGDFLIWDNRSCIHNYFGGWGIDERIFDRYCIGVEAPFFDLPEPDPTVVEQLAQTILIQAGLSLPESDRALNGRTG